VSRKSHTSSEERTLGVMKVRSIYGKKNKSMKEWLKTGSGYEVIYKKEKPLAVLTNADPISDVVAKSSGLTDSAQESSAKINRTGVKVNSVNSSLKKMKPPPDSK